MCKECENKEQEVKVPFKNYTLEELETAYNKGNQPTYTPQETAWFYNLYNRVYKTNKQPGCGKCFVNIRKHLSTRYKIERDGK
jgi:hypothetical protein